MKILLIQPPLSGNLESITESVVEPLGLAYIAGVLEEEGYSVKILDCHAEGIDELEYLGNAIYRRGISEEKIKEYLYRLKPDIVGISCMFSAYAYDSLRVAELVKECLPDTLIVLGGVGCSANSEYLLKHSCADVAVIGEGEITFLEIVKNLEKKYPIKNILGTAIKLNGKIIKNISRPLIEDLDILPFPARHLLPMEKYFEIQKRGKGTYKYYLRNPLSHIITSRGCPFNCSFCAVSTIWGRSYRIRSPEQVILEIEDLVRNYKIKELAFWDDNISLDKERFIKLCHLLKKEKLNLTWQTPNGIAFWNLDPPLLKLMKESGYYRATFAIESGSSQTLAKYVDKPIDFKKAKELIRVCNRLGIWTYGVFIIGFPDEKLSQIKETAYLIRSLGFDFVAIFIAQPYVGTRLFNVFQEMGLISDFNYPQGSSMVYSKFNTLYFIPKQLWKIQQKIYLHFLFYKILTFFKISSLLYLYKKINNWEKFRYFLRLVGNIIGQRWFGHRV
ncbi:MAG: B12-binding domain-containing radical SAM protein [Candidatus Omnitrophica bacterium]|nr:B12-binding domain-containing radical SAM protein [Candidatus Omnitrophota bacterium]MCM8793082.1 B12-binding domain-containing radical SAM protein [Candidatus Omnitrophota bacterium]